MKKIISILLGIILTLSLVSCNNNLQPNDPIKPPDNTNSITDFVNTSSANYIILISDKATAGEIFASNELKSFIKQSVGVEMTIKKESLVGAEKFISLGDTKKLANAKINFDYSSLNNDGFFIKDNDSNIYIDGANDKGTIYGVYEFLEELIGIKFLTADCTHIPTVKRVPFQKLDIVKKPVFRLRNYYNGIMEYSDEESELFQVRTRMNDGNELNNFEFYEDDLYMNELGGFGHNSLDYVKKSIYGKSHPEFYASFTNPNYEGSGYDDICYTNGITQDGKLDESMDISVAKVTLASLKEFATKNTDAKFFFIGLNDHMSGGNRDEKTLALNKKYGTESASIIIFINCMAREMKKWAETAYPGREINVGFFAYFWSEVPPTKIVDNKIMPIDDLVKMEENTFVRIAPLKANYGYSMLDEKQLPNVKSNFEHWATISPNIFVWDYSTFFKVYSRYYPDLSYYAENLKYYKQLGVSYVFNQSAWTSKKDWQSLLKYYVASKLYWDTELNVYDLIEEFVTLYNGEIAKPYVMNFIDTMENHFSDMRSKKGFFVDCTAITNTYNNYEYYNVGMFENLIKSFEKCEKEIVASSLASDVKEKFIQRLKLVKMTPLTMILCDYSNYNIDNEHKKELVEKLVDCMDSNDLIVVGDACNLSTFLDRYDLN